jgi:zinc protease
MQFEDVQAFFRTYYRPSNASLVLAGAIETDRAFELAERYFGDFPAGERPPSVSASASLAGDRLLVQEDRVELPRLYLAWHSPAMFGAGDADLDLGADLLANGKTSRLYRTLVYEKRIALDVSAAQHSRQLGGFFLLAVTAAPGRGLAEIAAIVDEEVRRVAADGPTGEEMERGEAHAEAQFMYRLQTVGGFGGKSDQLNLYNVMTGSPAYFASDLARYRAASAASVRGAVATYLTGRPRVALSVVPFGKTDLALPGSEPVQVS